LPLIARHHTKQIFLVRLWQKFTYKARRLKSKATAIICGGGGISFACYSGYLLPAAGDHPKGIDSSPAEITVGFRQLQLRLGSGQTFISIPPRNSLPSSSGAMTQAGASSRAQSRRTPSCDNRGTSALTGSVQGAIREPQIHQDLHPAPPFGGKR
jgi:hypothetical protein